MCSWFIHEPIGGALTKSSREIMEILEAFDLTRCAWSAAGCDAKTVARYVRVRDRGGDPFAVARRARLIDPFLDKVEELVEASQGKVRADVVHERLVAMGFSGDGRSTRRAVAVAKAAWCEGHRRRYRPWVPSGTVKSHFVEALAHAVIDADMRVSWFTLESLTTTIGRARVDASIAKVVARICKSDLIVIDDIGSLPAGQDAAEAFYRVVDAAYERRSVAVTSNIKPAKAHMFQRTCARWGPKVHWFEVATGRRAWST